MSVETASDRLSRLVQKHRELDDQVTQLERRAYLTPDERRMVTELKKRKLHAKDEIFALRQQL
jgi:uncharacterized protein YdcH (DUF465 family)